MRLFEITDPQGSLEWMLFLTNKYLGMFIEGTGYTLYIATIGTLLGFVLGSILCIFPGWSAMLAFWPILMVVVGFVAMTLCSRISE